MKQMLRKPPSGKKGKGLKSLPTDVRNKMGFYKRGGTPPKKKAGCPPTAIILLAEKKKTKMKSPKKKTKPRKA